VFLRSIFGYVSGAAEDNRALDDNRRAFDELAFLPRVLCNVAQRHQQVTLFGTTYASPFGIAPMGIAALSVYCGDVVLARAAAQAQIPAVVTTVVVSSTALARRSGCCQPSSSRPVK